MVGETDSKATTRLLLAEAVILGLVPAHCWVDLGPGFCGYRALGGLRSSALGIGVWGQVLDSPVCRAVFRGGCGLRGSWLSSDGSGCVTFQLVAWFESSQYWCLLVGS